MQGTYDRLRVHVFASWRDVVRAANGRIAKKHRRAPAMREVRKRFYHEMLDCPKAPGSRPNLPALNLLSASEFTTHASRSVEHRRWSDAVRPKQESAPWR